MMNVNVNVCQYVHVMNVCCSPTANKFRWPELQRSTCD